MSQGSRVITRTIERGVRSTKSYDGNLNLTPVQHVKHQLNSFVQHTDDEKRELHTLNDRMNIYVDRVKALEGENFKLLKELQDLQSKWGDGTRAIKQQFERDLFGMRTRIDDTANLKAIADVKLKRAEYETRDLQNRFEELNHEKEADKSKAAHLQNELENVNSTLNSLGKALVDGEKDVVKYREQRDELRDRLRELADRLDEELLKRVTTEFCNQTLREHIEFIRQVHEKEVAEMEHLKNALPFNDQIEFYKDELKRVINNIRNDYDDLNREQKQEMEEWMKIKNEEMILKAKARDPLHDMEMSQHMESIDNLRSSLNQGHNDLEDIRKEQDFLLKKLQDLEDRYELEKQRINQRLEEQNNETNKLNENVNQLVNDYNALNSNKATLEYEIQVYKRLLDSQLQRLGTASVEKRDANMATTSSGAFGGKVQNRKEKKGSVGVSDASPDGKFIAIDNSGGTNNVIADLSGWKIKRKIDNTQEIIYNLPVGTLLVPGASIKIWSGNSDRQRTGNDIVNREVDNWGIGIHSITHLLNADGEEKSTFDQQITFGNY